MTISFNDKNVLVTGGSRGIGKACVELFLDSGASVAFTYKSAESEAAKIINEYSRKAKVKGYIVDLRNKEDVEMCTEKILNDFGTIDILVNNAGIWKEAAIDKMTHQQWNEMMDTNLTSTFILTKLLVPGMKKNNFGRIINVASTAGQRGEAFHSHYAASKGGMISFTKSLGSELGKYNITVNCVAPGWVITDMTHEALDGPDTYKKVLNDIPLNKIALPEEIAGPVLFLASDLLLILQAKF